MLLFSKQCLFYLGTNSSYLSHNAHDTDSRVCKADRHSPVSMPPLLSLSRTPSPLSSQRMLRPQELMLPQLPPSPPPLLLLHVPACQHGLARLIEERGNGIKCGGMRKGVMDHSNRKQIGHEPRPQPTAIIFMLISSFPSPHPSIHPSPTDPHVNGVH